MTRPLPDFLCPPITRVDIAWTCVATDDPNPIHLDREFAAERSGFPDIVVPGTMLVGWVGEYLEAHGGGIRNLRGWQIRFVEPVWPGERITLSGEIEDGPDELTCRVTARTRSGRVVARATAELAR